MVDIANKPFTQYTNLNILDELRIHGILVLPGGGEDITTVTSEYTQEVTDDVIVATGTFNINLIPLSEAVKPVVIRAVGASTITLVPDGSDTAETTTVSPDNAVKLVPHSTIWLEIT